MDILMARLGGSLIPGIGFMVSTLFGSIANASCSGWSQRWQVPYTVLAGFKNCSRRRKEAEFFSSIRFRLLTFASIRDWPKRGTKVRKDLTQLPTNICCD